MDDFPAQIAQVLAQGGPPAPAYSELPVKWVKTSPGNPPQMEVRDGVCVVYAPDDSRGRIPGVAELFKACLAQGGLALDEPAGSKRIGWFQANNLPQLNQTWQNALGRAPQYRGVDLRGWHMLGSPNLMGTVSPHGSVGHEMKHIFDGEFHQ